MKLEIRSFFVGSLVWRWVDGTKTDDYTYWTPNQPDSNDDQSYCAYIWYSSEHDGHWDDCPCDINKGYICQKEKSKYCDSSDFPCIFSQLF